MSLRAFENWTAESVPCPQCGLLLPAADAACPRCGGSGAHSASAAAPTRAAAPPPAPPPLPYPQYVPPREAYLPLETYLQPAAPAGYADVRPARRGPRPGLIAGVLALLLVLGGAGYGVHRLASHSSHAAAVGVPTASGVLSTAAPIGKLALSAIPVTADELPGWQVSAPDSSPSDIESDKKLAHCMGVKYTGVRHGPTAEADYRLGPYLVSSWAQRMRHSDVASDVAMLTNPRLRGCMRKPMGHDLAKAIPGARLRSARLEIRAGTHGGPANLAGIISTRLVLEIHGQTRTMYVDSAMIAGRRLESQITFTGVDGRVDAAVQARLVAAVAERTADAE